MDTQPFHKDRKANLSPTNKVIFKFFTHPSHRKSRWSFSMQLATLVGMGKRDKKYVGRLESMLLIRVTLPLLERYIRFQLANRRSIFSTMTSQIDWGREEVPQPKMPVNLAMLSALPTGTKIELARLTFKPETASKNKSRTRRCRR
jgi:hypothetical protein